MLRVKICGITRPEDARLAAELGADAIGVVFHPESPRCVTVERAAEIAAGLPSWVARVGVFVDAEIDLVRDTVKRARLTSLQLHGNESMTYIEALALNLPILKGIAMQPGWQERLTEYAGIPILLDHAGAGNPGGTGEVWDWAGFDPTARPKYFILAGGLRPDNVAEAIERLQPDAVDVSSGVEREPGIKDEEKLKAFFAAVQPYRVIGG